ncbi:MAG TPA: EAL domain-containing protein [Herpetosiphonaceae bacterium]
MTRTRIMVVEDEQIIALDLRETLERLGYCVAALVASGEEALDQAARARPDLALMDIKLQGALDGIDAAERLRRQFGIPVIYLTAHADTATLQRAKLTEPYGYVLKPFEERELHIQIEMALYKDQIERKLHQLERWLSATLTSIGDAVITTDTSGTISFMNPKAEQLTMWLQDTAVGRPVAEVLCLISATTRQPVEDLVPRVLHDGMTIELDDETMLVARDGHQIAVDDTAAPIRDDYGKITGVVIVFRDVTERKAAEEALRASEERYALAAQGANDGLWDWDLQSDRIYYSPRWKSMLGHAEHEVGGKPDEWFDRVHPEDREALHTAITEYLHGPAPRLEIEQRIRHADGTYRWMLVRGLVVRDQAGLPVRMAGSITDITAHKQAEDQLRHDALHDALTGLPNRTLFLDRLHHALDYAQRHPTYQCALLFLDLDHFKTINDSLGHAVGDDLLRALAHRLESCLRTGDTLARLGGDEFTILLDGITDKSDAVRVAERIQHVLKVPFSLEGHELFASTSIGIALSSAGYTDAQTMMRDADSALYHAKHGGRAAYQFFNQEMHVLVRERLRLETDLRNAVERREFVLHYQPIVDLQSGAITGLEALVRWQHPQHGLLYPAAFLNVAEETGLIVPIGAWVLREACRQLGAWHALFPGHAALTVNVNLSGRQLIDTLLLDQIDLTLSETHVGVDCVRMEITESMLMETSSIARTILDHLRTRGTQLALDDFGTGYSSLSLLRRLPISVLKIDQSFVKDLDNPENAEIVRTIIALAHNLGMRVVGEGVETEAQYRQLRAWGCDGGQGYFFAPPLDRDAIEGLLKEGGVMRAV